jgi:predicted patatin/cPLA2 family phospholipase
VICPKLFIDYDSKWRQNYYAIHLFIRGKRITFPDWCFDGRKHVDFEFDDEVSKNLNTTYGEMARLVFNFEDSLNEVQSVA